MKSFDGRDDRRVLIVPKTDRYGAFGASLLLLEGDRLLLAFGRIDFHRGVSQKAIMESRDRGRTWLEPRIVDESPGIPKTMRADSLSVLQDGRMALVGVHQAPKGRATGFEIRFSEDGGYRWEKPIVVEGAGSMPWCNRLVEADGKLLATTRAPVREGGTKKEVLQCESDDGGRTWAPPRTIATDPVLKLTEPSTIGLQDGRLMTVIRETSYNFYPSYRIFSTDLGLTWTDPEPLPIFGHEMCLGQLRSGNVMVAYRHVGGYAGTLAWVGSPDERGFQVPATISARLPPKIEGGLLRVRTEGKGETVLYHLHPPEGVGSTIHIDAELACIEDEGNACAIHVAQAGWVSFHPDRVELPDSGGISAAMDATKLHQYLIIRDPEQLTVCVDGEKLLETRDLQRGPEVKLDYGLLHPNNVNAFGTQSPFVGDPNAESRGEAHWASLRLRIQNPGHPPHHFDWSAGSGMLPNQYEEDRLLEIERGYGDSIYFYGQVSWAQFADGEIFVATGRQYFRSDGRRSSYIRGCYLWEEDFGPDHR